jgi:L,D-transpeptidase ErfK/SrfK
MRSIKPSRTGLFAALMGGLLALVITMPGYAATYVLPPPSVDIIGEVSHVTARYEDTLIDIARNHGLGFEEILRANPGVDPWLPGEGTVVVLPTKHILPDAPREGIVVNLPEMRLYYYPKPENGAQPVVITYPISIGRMDWRTPLGTTRVTSKVENPTWIPPASIRTAYAERGETLPPSVPPGPDNPLGKHSLRLDLPGYLIHGTNKPFGIGMRATHGCLRLYPEDIAALHGMVPVGTKVHIVDQPFKAGWKGETLYLQVYPPLEEAADPSDLTPAVRAVVAATRERHAEVDWDQAMTVVEFSGGLPAPIGTQSEHQALQVVTEGPEVN